MAFVRAAGQSSAEAWLDPAVEMVCSGQTLGRCWCSAGHSAHLTYGEIGKSPFSLMAVAGFVSPLTAEECSYSHLGAL